MTIALSPGSLEDDEIRAARLAEEARTGELAKLLKDTLLPAWSDERERLDRIDGWYRWSPDKDITLPAGATREHKALRDLSRVPWLGLVVTSCAQCMYVDGWRSGGASAEPEPITAPDGVPAPVLAVPEASTPWRIWQANDLDTRQVAIHRSMLAYGYTYVTVLPGVDWEGNPMPKVRGVSPRKMIAVYDDPAEDDWPRFALQVLGSPDDQDLKVRLFDDQLVRTIIVHRGVSISVSGRPQLTVIRTEAHGCGVCPVVRYANQLDLDGRTPGEVEPHIPIAARINKTSYDRLLVQHFNSWKIRTATGMTEPETREEADRKKLQLRHEDMLIAEDPDTKFGTLDETQLAGFINAHQADIEALAAVTQTPTHELTGQLVNVSAEGLAMIRASQQQKVDERKLAAGKGHRQMLRLGAHYLGDAEAAADPTGRVTWQDTSIRSLAQAVDALGKAKTMLEIPAQALWGRIPGFEKTEVDEMIELAARLDPIERMRADLARQAMMDAAPPPNQGGNPSGPPPNQGGNQSSGQGGKQGNAA